MPDCPTCHKPLLYCDEDDVTVYCHDCGYHRPQATAMTTKASIRYRAVMALTDELTTMHARVGGRHNAKHRLIEALFRFLDAAD